MSLTTPDPVHDAAPETPQSTPVRPPGGWQSLVRRLHFYAGILVAPFLLVAAISGGLYAIAPSLEQLVYRDTLHTSSTGSPAPVADQVRAAMAIRPDLTVSAVRPAAEPGDTTRVLFDDPTLGDSERRAVFIDPVTLHSTGEYVSYGSSAALPMRTWISNLHRNLHLGEPGRLYSELAASWLWVIALGGLALWVTRFRRLRAARRARLLTVDRSTSGHARSLSWHGAIGIWTVVGLVFLSATGLTWSTYAGANVTDLRSALNWTTPAVNTEIDAAPTPSAHAGHDGHGPTHASAGTDDAALRTNVDHLDEVLAVARGAGVDGKVEASIPAASGTAVTVTQTREAWQFSPDSVAVDAASGAIVDESRFADWPLAAKLTNWGIALHMGILFGLVSQILLLLLAIGLVVLIVRGYQMWWQRRPRRVGVLAVGRPPLRGAVAGLPIPVVVAGAVVTALVGWFIPLLGLSLLAFLVVDAAIAVVRSRLASPPTSPGVTD